MDACIDYVLNNGLKNYCYFLGAKENPYPYIKLADVYVQPSFVEAEPTTIKEAKILKKIIIATEIPAIKEILNNGEFGCLVPKEKDKFVEAIINLYYNSELRSFYEENLSQNCSVNEESKNKIRQLLLR